MSDIRYSDEHEWIRVEDGVGTVGVTNYAVEQLGDVVFVELPETGQRFAKGEQVAVVESVKAASEIYIPVGGTVSEINQAVVDEPALVNQDPKDKAWLFRIKLADESELTTLMTEDQYKEFVKGQ